MLSDDFEDECDARAEEHISRLAIPAEELVSLRWEVLRSLLSNLPLPPSYQLLERAQLAVDIADILTKKQGHGA